MVVCRQAALHHERVWHVGLETSWCSHLAFIYGLGDTVGLVCHFTALRSMGHEHDRCLYMRTIWPADYSHIPCYRGSHDLVRPEFLVGPRWYRAWGVHDWLGLVLLHAVAVFGMEVFQEIESCRLTRSLEPMPVDAFSLPGSRRLS